MRRATICDIPIQWDSNSSGISVAFLRTIQLGFICLQNFNLFSCIGNNKEHPQPEASLRKNDNGWKKNKSVFILHLWVKECRPRHTHCALGDLHSSQPDAVFWDKERHKQNKFYPLRNRLQERIQNFRSVSQTFSLTPYLGGSTFLLRTAWFRTFLGVRGRGLRNPPPVLQASTAPCLRLPPQISCKKGVAEA